LTKNKKDLSSWIIIKKRKIKNTCLTAIATVMILIALYGVSWIATCGIIKLITICFGFTFRWLIATGIWLILVLLRGIFSVTVKK
jgi:hypothetical protein